MNQALKIGITILGMYVFFQAFTAIANFVGLSMEDYINYLLWVIALIIFWLFLPRDSGSVFFN